MLTGLTHALKGIGGEFEINRVCGALGTIIYVIGANGFIAWNMLNGKEFNVTEYCLAFPGGLAVCVGAIAGAVAVKDRNVATAQVIRDTGARLGDAPTTTAEPQQVEVVNTPENPANVQEAHP